MPPNRIKILYIITKSNWGGAQRYVYDLVTSLPKGQFEGVVATGGDGIMIDRLLAAGIRVLKVTGLKRDVGPIAEISVFISLLRILRAEEPAIVHLNSSKVGGIGGLAARVHNVSMFFRGRPRTKIIFTAHGWAFNENRPWFIKKIITALSLITVFLSHKTININEKEFNQVKKWPFRSGKMALVWNGINADENSPRVERKRRHGQPIVIGTIGELTANKGFVYLIPAVAGLSKYNILLCMIGDGEDRNKIEDLIALNNLEERVVMLGFKERASSLLPLFDIFVMPSVKEGLPYAIMEAGQVGLPIIATNVGGIPEIIENGKSGILIDPKDSGQIKEALEMLINNPEIRKTMGQNIKETIEKKFALSNMVRKTISLYERVLGLRD